MVLNVGTAAAIADAIVDGMPLISRITTVAGNVKQPSNLRVRIGTPVHDIIKACGGYLSPPGKIVFGGSMTGICMPDDTVSVTKANNGIIVLDQKEAALPDERQCIRCGRCIRACPIYLNPFRLKHWADTGDFEQAEKEHVMDCIVCGACSYVCPARRQLSASIKAAKDAMTARRVKQ
ncbi:MAG: 4Fe-4S dicluster domain-containing protein [Clostridiales bacterium]|nr:4Fe-4S dicluster domain-containing protein [Clostridiales bacterium]